MTIAFWSDYYKTGDAKVDEQHEHLFKMVNTLHDAMMKGQGREVVRKILNELIIYTVEHFATEEMLMLSNQYPDYKQHKEKHDDLKQQVQVLVKKVDLGQASINLEVLHFLNEWLIHHIKGEDQKMINFLKQKNKNLPSMPLNKEKEILARTQKTFEMLKQAREALKKIENRSKM